MAPKPNILVLLTDQQSHHLMSCAGTPWLKTPHLDRLAAGGARFTRAYCSNPVCVPSRFSMFTGRRPSAIGLRGNDSNGLHAFTPAHEQASLGHLLRAAGYATWYGGKTHWPLGLTPERLGFTGFCTDERERLAVEAADHIHRQSGQPWAMVVSLINPHDICYQAIRAFPDDSAFNQQLLRNGAVELGCLDEALQPPLGVDYDTFLRDHLPPLPANHEVQTDEPALIREVLAQRPFKLAARQEWVERDWRLHRWAYARLMERVDRQIGVVLDALEASGQAKDTLVLMTSDHGDHDGSHRLEHKTFFYEEAVRVPWLMRLPGRIPAGRVEDSCLVATGLDLMATCCDYAGAALPGHCRGVSQRGVAENRSEASQRGQAFGENLVSCMLVEQSWKYVRYDSGAHAEQLYDLYTDPGESRNHAHDAANVGVLARLSQDLDDEITAHATHDLGPPVTASSGK